MRRSAWLMVVLLCAACVALAQGIKVEIAQAHARAQPDPAVAAEDDDEATRKIKQLLRTKKVTFDFNDTQLGDALSFVRALLDVNIIVDPEVKTKQALTLTVRDMNVGAALQWLLRLAGAEMAIKDGAIHVKPSEKADAAAPKVYGPDARRYRRMIGKAEIKVGEVASIELYLYEDDLPAETREMVLKLLKVSLEAELRNLARDPQLPKPK